MKLQKIYNDIIKAYFEDNYNSRFAFEESGDYVCCLLPCFGDGDKVNAWAKIPKYVEE